MDRKDFLTAVDLLEALPIPTIGGRKTFLVKRSGEDVEYTPTSTGKSRIQGKDWLDRLIAKWNKTQSLKRSDYNETVHGSYFLAIIKYVLGLRPEPEKNTTAEDYRDSFRDTVRIAEKETRIGQDLFKRKLLHFWRGGSVEDISNPEFLIASHIKPWSISEPQEKLDVYNGLLLSPNMDRLFELGYISFDDGGALLVSVDLDAKDMEIFGVCEHLRLKKVESKHISYLRFHRESKHPTRRWGFVA